MKITVGKGASARFRWNDNTLIINLEDMPDNSHYRIISKGAKSDAGTVLRRVEEHFSRVSRIPLPETVTTGDRKRASTRWWKPLREIIALVDGDEEMVMQMIEDAIVQMRDSGLDISSPASILNKVISNYARQDTEVEVW